MRAWHYSSIATLVSLVLVINLWRSPNSLMLAAGLLGYLAAMTYRFYKEGVRTRAQILRETFDNMEQVSVYRKRDAKRFSGPLADRTDSGVSVFVVRHFDYNEHVIMITNPGDLENKQSPPGPTRLDAA